MPRPELLAATDAIIDDAVEHVEPIVLRGLLYLLIGDEAVAAVPHASETRGVLGTVTTLTDPDHVAFLRAKAAAFLKAYRDAGAGDWPLVRERLHRGLELAAGGTIADDEISMWIEQAGFDPAPRGYDGPPLPEGLAESGFQVAVIGTGMGGLNAAVQLKQAGIPFVCLEKNADVGGTWHENRYPGVRLDTTSRSYFHSFAADFPCPGPYSVGAHNARYLNWVADEYALRDDIRFGTEVQSVTWDEGAGLWEIRARTPEGPKSWRVAAVISAVGFLSRPNIPEVEGLDSFEGVALHTARWSADLDLADKRVAVIGSGATGYQMIPELAKQAGHLTLFQREPSWCFEAPGYLAPYAPQVNWLDRNLPYLTNLLRFRSSWLFRPDATLPRVTIDPGFDDPHAVSELNKVIRDGCLAFMRRKFGDRDDLIAQMTPASPPFSSRPVLVDSQDNIYDALLRDNVDLVSDRIERITPNGLRTADGREHEVDVIVFATGYRANDFLWPMELRGRGGASCEALWEKDGARAYLGTMLPDFPNFFIVYGPNMNSFGNGLGVIETEELATRFAVNCIGGMLAQGGRTVDVGHEAFARFNEALDREEAKRVYADARATSYYKNEHRRSACNCPFDVRLLWHWMRDPVEGSHADPAAPVRAHFGADLIVA